MYNIAKHLIHPEGAVDNGCTQGPLQIWASALVTIVVVETGGDQRMRRESMETQHRKALPHHDWNSVPSCCEARMLQSLWSAYPRLPSHTPCNHNSTPPTVVALCSPLLGGKGLEEFGCAVTLYSLHCQQRMNKLGEANSVNLASVPEILFHKVGVRTLDWSGLF